MWSPEKSRWLIEMITPHEYHLHGVQKYYVTTKTPYQSADILETYEYGKCLVLDGKIQSSAADEHTYHELLVHPAMITHPAPKRICIIGGGEGATLREVLLYPTVEQAVMIDIDEEVVRLCERYLPEWHQGSFQDRRTLLRFEDARKYLERERTTYDIILIDLTEPLREGPSYLLFTKQFYQIVQERLGPDGIVSLQTASTNPIMLECHASIIKTLREVFPIVRPFQGMIPSFDSMWGFAIASKRLDPETLTADEVEKRRIQRGLKEWKFYEGLIHSTLFKLPRYLRNAYETQGRVAEDHNPVFFS